MKSLISFPRKVFKSINPLRILDKTLEHIFLSEISIFNLSFNHVFVYATNWNWLFHVLRRRHVFRSPATQIMYSVENFDFTFFHNCPIRLMARLLVNNFSPVVTNSIKTEFRLPIASIMHDRPFSLFRTGLFPQ